MNRSFVTHRPLSIQFFPNVLASLSFPSPTPQETLADLMLQLQLVRREKRGLELREAALRAQGPAHALLLAQLRWERAQLGATGTHSGAGDSSGAGSSEEEEERPQGPPAVPNATEGGQVVRAWDPERLAQELAASLARCVPGWILRRKRRGWGRVYGVAACACAQGRGERGEGPGRATAGAPLSPLPRQGCGSSRSTAGSVAGAGAVGSEGACPSGSEHRAEQRSMQGAQVGRRPPPPAAYPC